MVFLTSMFRKNKNLEKFSESQFKNIYGNELQKCQGNKSDLSGSWIDGYCQEQGVNTGVHQLCFKVDKDTSDFSEKTYQSKWSESRKGKNHCMCLGAYALYKERQKANKNNENYNQTKNELVCNAIPNTVFDEKYVNNWNTWNGNQLPNQIKSGLESLVRQCFNESTIKSDKDYLRNKYCNLAMSKKELQNSDLYTQLCSKIETMSQNFKPNYLKKFGDEKIKEIFNKDPKPKDPKDYNEILKLTHKWCANMRNSPSIITAPLPLLDEQNKNEFYFPISVCCSSDYCEMLDDENYPKFRYREYNGIYYLIKIKKSGKKIVQIIEKFTTEKNANDHINNNQNLYFPLITFDRIKNDICKTYLQR